MARRDEYFLGKMSSFSLFHFYQMSFNVKVTDVLPARIRALRSKDQGWQNVGAGRRGNGVSHDLADRNPVGGAQSPPELLPFVIR